MKKLLFWVAFLCNLPLAYMQDTSDIDKYFDVDTYFAGGDKYTRNIVKFGLTPLFNGEINGYYERRFFKKLSIEFGVGAKLPFHGISAWTLAEIPNPFMGGNAQVHLRFYPAAARQSSPIQSFFASFGIKQTWFVTMEDEFWVIRDYVLGIGGSRTLSNRYSFEFYVGGGFSVLQPHSRIDQTRNNPRQGEIISPLLPYTVKICHSF